MSKFSSADMPLPRIPYWHLINRKIAFYFSFLLLALAVATLSFAQPGSKTVSGFVRNESKEPLSGVTVAVKGSSASTVTDNNGRYSITVPSANSVLVFTSVGFAAQEQTVQNNSNIEISLKTSDGALEDVVVVGYGTRKKETLTGSISSVDAKVFQNRGPIANPLAALQGQVPGVTVTRSSAQPGREGWSFQMRGASSVNNTEPLVVIDGVPVPGINALNSINPNDIENISFLKDAAASIYGSRAAGGVVLITTKRARSGKPIIEFNTSVSRKIMGLRPDLVDIDGWGPMIKEARENDGFTTTSGLRSADGFLRIANAAIYARQNGIDWMTSKVFDSLTGNVSTDTYDNTFFKGTMQDYLWGDATSYEHQLSVSQRNDRSGYRVSLGFLDDGSLMQYGNNSNKRYNLRLSHDYTFSTKLKMATNLSLEKNDIIQPTQLGSVLNNAIQPGMPAFTINGKPYLWGSGIGNAATPSIAALGGDNKEANTRINTNLNLTYDLSKSLKLVGSAGYYLLNTDYRTKEDIISFYDYAETRPAINLPTRNSYQRGNKQQAYYTANAYLEYGTRFNNVHDLRATAGVQYERNEFNRYIARSLDILPGVPNSLSLSTGDATSKTVAEAQDHYALAGYFGRINYTFNNKYLFEVNGRYDGSSRFDANNRWKGFYGLLAGWRISQENFIKDVTFINELKLRASWGNVGNQTGIGLYDYIQLLPLNFSPGATNASYPIIGTSPVVRINPGNTLVALDRTWETVETSNLGLDFSLLKNRLSGTLEYFIKKNKNMLIARTYSAVLGANAPDGNNGNLETKGWEFSLNWQDKIGDLSYHFGGNISDNTNNLIGFGGQKLISTANRGMNGSVEGYPLNTYFGLEYAGRIQSQKELDDYRAFIPNNTVGMPAGAANARGDQRLAIGDNMFKDLNGDGKITFPEDAKPLGTDNPRYIYSFNGGLAWKGFDFNVIFQGVGKKTIVRDGNWRIPAQVVFQGQNAAFLNKWWTPTRTDAPLPRISTSGNINNYNYFPSDWVAEDGSYLRLKNLVVGYTLPARLTQRAHIQRLRVYFSGNDLWETQKIRDGWDPEAPRTVNNTGDPENGNVSTFSQRYPFYRYVTFGLNVTF